MFILILNKNLNLTGKFKMYSFILFNGYVRFYCRYDGNNFEKCPNNENGLCRTKYLYFPNVLIHKFDKKNCIKCLCG